MTQVNALQSVVTVSPVGIEISSEQLLQMLFDVNGSNFVQIWSRTEPAMNITGNTFLVKNFDKTYTSTIVKKSCFNAMIGFEYAKSVNSRRIKESIEIAKECGIDKETLETFLAQFGKKVEVLKGRFEPYKHPWAVHCQHPIIGTTSRIVMKNGKREDGKRYLMVSPLRTDDPTYHWADTDEKLTPEEVAEAKTFFTKKSSNKEHQGLKKELPVRTYLLENVTGITLNKVKYQIT